jgi:hypothetical protein
MIRFVRLDSMIASRAPEVLDQFCKNPWKFQQTFETPLKSLQSFVATIVSSGEPLRHGSLTIDQVVFEPRDLSAMLAKYSIPPKCERGLCLTAAGRKEVEELLGVVLGEWIDFLFVPDPQVFAIYADHDEFTTFYAHNRTNLERIASALSNGGFKAKPEYQRRF